MKWVSIDLKQAGLFGVEKYLIKSSQDIDVLFFPEIRGGFFQGLPEGRLRIHKGDFFLEDKMIGGFEDIFLRNNFSIYGENYLLSEKGDDREIYCNNEMIASGVHQYLSSILFYQFGGLVEYKFKQKSALIPSLIAIYCAFLDSQQTH